MLTTLPTAFFFVAALTVVLTGISKSGFAGGLGVMQVPILSLFVTPQFAAAVVMPILLIMDIWIVWHYRRHWQGRVVAMMLPGAFAGLALGAIGFSWMSAEVIRLAVGIMALMLVAGFVLLGPPAARSRTTPAPVVFSLGAISGFTSFIAHAGGPPVKGYLLSQNMEKSQFVGTNTMFFFVLNAIKTAAYAGMGQLTWCSLQVSAIIAPMLVAGIFLGTYLHGRLDQNSFVKLVYGFLALTGVKLIWDSAPMLLGA